MSCVIVINPATKLFHFSRCVPAYSKVLKQAVARAAYSLF
jgi:hypothetical protein